MISGFPADGKNQVNLVNFYKYIGLICKSLINPLQEWH